MLVDLDLEDIRTITVFLPMALRNYRPGSSVKSEIDSVLKKLPKVDTQLGRPPMLLEEPTSDNTLMVEALHEAIASVDDMSGDWATKAGTDYRELYKRLTGKEFSY